MNLFHLSILACILLNGCATAQEITMQKTSSVSRQDLLTAILTPGSTISMVEIKEIILGPKLMAPLHFHPCPVVGVVMEGAISFEIEGKPVQHLKAGDAFYEPANVRVARFDNDGATPAKFTAFYLLGDDGQDLIRILPK